MAAKQLAASFSSFGDSLRQYYTRDLSDQNKQQ